VGALGTAFGLPGQLQGLSGQAFQDQMAPLLQALAFATGFAPVGTSGRDKSLQGNLGGALGPFKG
jgi:hypothetical protein